MSDYILVLSFGIFLGTMIVGQMTVAGIASAVFLLTFFIFA